MNTRRQTGNDGESYAATMLLQKGYRILARQARTPAGEIDLVAEHADEVVFVEVKTRTSHRYGVPEEAITRAKWNHMLRSAEYYLQAHGWEDRPYRIDVVAITFRTMEEPEVLHVEAVDGPYER